MSKTKTFGFKILANKTNECLFELHGFNTQTDADKALKAVYTKNGFINCYILYDDNIRKEFHYYYES